MNTAPNGKPKPEIGLLGEDGNAFAILGAARKAMRRAGWTDAEIAEYTVEATAGGYDHLMQTTMAYCEVS